MSIEKETALSVIKLFEKQLDIEELDYMLDEVQRLIRLAMLRSYNKGYNDGYEDAENYYN